MVEYIMEDSTHVLPIRPGVAAMCGGFWREAGIIKGRQPVADFRGQG